MVDTKELNKPQRAEKYIKTHYPELHDILINEYPEGLTWSERMYWYEHSITEHPICKQCGKEVDFINPQKGYRTYCSRECTAKAESRVSKYKNTCIKKYGVSNVSKLADIKKKKRETAISHFGGEGFESELLKSKAKETCVDRYGVEWAINNPSIKEKALNTLNTNYGVNIPLQSDKIKQKQCDTMTSLYGAPYYAITDQDKRAISESRRKNYSDSTGAVFDDGWWYPCPHPECNKCQDKRFKCDPTIYYDRERLGYETCTVLNPKYIGSTGENAICGWLDEWCVDYIKHDRSIIKPRELDIYIPSKNLAIEYNGIFFHSTKSIPDHKYHMNKWKTCRESGVQLITIWEDQVMNHPEIVKSLLASKLGIYNIKIYARKCKVLKIDRNIGNSFLDNNHLQGGVSSGVYYGAYYNNELVGVMAFRLRSKVSGGKNHPNDWELIRFCTSRGAKVIGLASKMLNVFVKEYSPKKIVSFSSNDISNGELYKRLGFKEDGLSSAYWYISVKNSMKRYHRSSFSKSTLKAKGYNINGKTETDITDNISYLFRIYDSGHIKWVYDI